MPTATLPEISSDHRAKLIMALVDLGFLSTAASRDLQETLANWPNSQALVAYLTSHSIATTEQINKAYARVFRIPFVTLPPVPDAEVMRHIDREVSEKYRIVAYRKEAQSLYVAVADPLHITENRKGVLGQLKEKRGLKINLAICSAADFEKWFKAYSPPEPATFIERDQKPSTVTPPQAVSHPEPTYVSLLGKTIPALLLHKIPFEVARSYRFVVYDKKDASAGEEELYYIACESPSDPRLKKALSYIEQANHVHFKIFSTDARSIDASLAQYKPAKHKIAERVSLLAKSIAPEVLNKVPYAVASKYRFIVYDRRLSTYLVASDRTEDPLLDRIWHYIEEHNHVSLQIHPCDSASLNFGLALYAEAPKVIHQNVFLTSPEAKDAAAPPVTPSALLTKNTQAVSADEHTTSGWWGKVLHMLHLDKRKDAAILSVDVVPDTIKHDPEELERLKRIERAAHADEQPLNPTSQNRPSSTSKPPLLPKPQAQKVATGPIIQNIVAPDSEKASPQRQSKQEMYHTVAEASKKENEVDEDDLGSLLEKDVESIDELEQIIKDGFIPKMVAAIVNYAITLHASDVHIEAEAKDVRIRYRVDGMLQDVTHIPLESQAAIVSRIKILSKLKIDETRIPQDGRFDVLFKDRGVDLRVSSMPMVHGEKIVMRILDKTHGIMSLEDLGVVGRAFDCILEAIKKPYGIVLSTGPTGSGKSTTLYAILNRISVPTVNVITLEDPVEYEIAGVNQSQIKPKIGFTFAEGLRSVLRQDPNIIMVGEIRDSETANMATHSALTGHLVLSTLHTNDAAGALPRLMNMGVEPFLITSSINAVEAQRLVRKVCQNCKEEITLPPAVVQEIKNELERIPTNNPKDRARVSKEFKFYHGKGCEKCQNGYKGRIGIYEVMPMSDKIEELAIQKATATDILKQAIEEGMITMKQDGLLKALAGQTTVDEVMRETSV